MDVVILGDTHEHHREVEVPAGDLLIVVGDFTTFSKSLKAIEDFNDWLGELPHRWKCVVPGNHEFFLETDRTRTWMLDNATILIDSAVTVGGLKVYGSPITPLYGGAFGMSSPRDRRKHWGLIPDDTDILVTHGPPLGILDVPPCQSEQMGDPELLARVSELPSLRLHAFGHIHGAYGIFKETGVTYVNAALMGTLGDLQYPPVVVRMP